MREIFVAVPLIANILHGSSVFAVTQGVLNDGSFASWTDARIELTTSGL
jgi:hypothetical protein